MSALAYRHVLPLQAPPIHASAAPWVPYVVHTVRRLGFELETVMAALSIASHAHAHQVRTADNAPYISHSVAVALAYTHHPSCGQAGFIAGLLHDVLEDAPQYGSAVENLFDAQVTRMIECLSKVRHLPRLERIRDLHKRLSAHLAETGDPAVAILKLADRSHNLTTSAHLSTLKLQDMARESHDFYAPLATRLGLTRLSSWLTVPAQWNLRHPEGFLGFMSNVFTENSCEKQFQHILTN